jgi:hypothetical protein
LIMRNSLISLIIKGLIDSLLLLFLFTLLPFRSVPTIICLSKHCIVNILFRLNPWWVKLVMHGHHVHLLFLVMYWGKTTTPSFLLLHLLIPLSKELLLHHHNLLMAHLVLLLLIIHDLLRLIVFRVLFVYHSFLSLVIFSFFIQILRIDSIEISFLMHIPVLGSLSHVPLILLKLQMNLPLLIFLAFLLACVFKGLISIVLFI